MFHVFIVMLLALATVSLADTMAECGADSEDSALADVSLLQTELRLHPEPRLAAESVLEKSREASAKSSAAGAGATVAAHSNVVGGIRPIHSSAKADHHGASLTEQQHRSHTSQVARAIAWLKIELREANFMAMLVVLLAGLVICLAGMLVSGGPSTLKQTGGGEDSHPFRPQGVGTAPVVTRAALPVQTPRSGLPTQQTLAERTPMAAAVSVPLPAENPYGGLQEEASKKLDELPEVPPICPQLILPHTEARFMIPMEDLQTVSGGSINIQGTSGRNLLNALVCDSPDARQCLMLASCGCEDDPRACIFTPQPGEPSQALEIFGKAGMFYGWLDFPSQNSALVLFGGESGIQKPVLRIESGSTQDMRMSASTVDGRLLASAGRNVGHRGREVDGVDYWKMQVKPGVDAVLITSCMLALILLRPWPEQRLSVGGGSTVGGGTAMSLRPHHSPAPSPLAFPMLRSNN